MVWYENGHTGHALSIATSHPCIKPMIIRKAATLQAGDSPLKKFEGSIVNALVFIAFVCIITFGLVLLMQWGVCLFLIVTCGPYGAASFGILNSFYHACSTQNLFMHT